MVIGMKLPKGDTPLDNVNFSFEIVDFGEDGNFDDVDVEIYSRHGHMDENTGDFISGGDLSCTLRDVFVPESLIVVLLVDGEEVAEVSVNCHDYINLNEYYSDWDNLEYEDRTVYAREIMPKEYNQLIVGGNWAKQNVALASDPFVCCALRQSAEPAKALGLKTFRDLAMSSEVLKGIDLSKV